MRDINDIKNYYENMYEEDERLNKDKVHKIEYLTTLKYIEKYLKENDRLLEVGAGCGAYSIYFANKGYKVDSVELISKNLDLLKSKITSTMDINPVLGDALDLSMYKDNTFDVTLVLGPLISLI